MPHRRLRRGRDTPRPAAAGATHHARPARARTARAPTAHRSPAARVVQGCSGFPSPYSHASQTPLHILPGRPLLHIGREVGGIGIAVPVRGRPSPQDREEPVVADSLTQLLQHHRPPPVHGRVGDLPGVRRVRRRELPDLLPGLLRVEVRAGVHRVERLLRAVPAVVLVPQPLRVGREPLVEPHVPPALGRDGVAVPLVGQLMDEQRDVGGAGEHRPGLRLQGVADGRSAVDDRAGGGEGVRPEPPLPPPQRLRNPPEHGPARRRLDRVDGRVQGQVPGPGAADVEAADREGGEVAGHRLAAVPHERRTAPRRPLAAQLPVGDGPQPLRHGHREVVGRLVGGVVVAGEPRHRPRRLAQREHPVRGAQPALLGAVRVGDGLGRSGVADGHAERVVPVDVVVRPDGEFLSGAVPAGGRAADGDLLDVHAEQIEVERGEVLGRPGGEGGGAGEVVGVGVVGEAQAVVGDVVAAVAGLREVRVADAGAARGAVHPAAARAEDERGGEQEGGGQRGDKTYRSGHARDPTIA